MNSGGSTGSFHPDFAAFVHQDKKHLIPLHHLSLLLQAATQLASQTKPEEGLACHFPPFEKQTIRSRTAHNPCKIRSVQDPFKIRSGSVQDPSKIRSRSVQNATKSVQNPFQVRSRFVQDVIQNPFKKSVQGPFKMRSRSFQDPLKIRSKANQHLGRA